MWKIGVGTILENEDYMCKFTLIISYRIVGITDPIVIII